MKKVLGLGMMLVVGMAEGGEQLLLEGWRFHLGEVVGAEQKGFDDSAWEKVRVPHDWAIKGPFDVTNDLQVTRIVQDGERREKRHTGRTGGLPWPGTGWYRRSLTIPAGTEYAELVFDVAAGAVIDGTGAFALDPAAVSIPADATASPSAPARSESSTVAARISCSGEV